MGKFCVLWIFLNLLSCSKGIHLIGLDTKGFERKLKIEDHIFSKQLSKHLVEAYQSVDQELSILPLKDSSWEIETVIIGIGIEGEINIFDSWQFKASPAIRMAIQKVEKDI